MKTARHAAVSHGGAGPVPKQSSFRVIYTDDEQKPCNGCNKGPLKGPEVQLPVSADEGNTRTRGAQNARAHFASLGSTLRASYV